MFEQNTSTRQMIVIMNFEEKQFVETHVSEQTLTHKHSDTHSH